MTRSLTASPEVTPGMRDLIDDFRREHDCEVHLWLSTDDGWTATDAGSDSAPPEPGPDAVDCGALGAEMRVQVVGGCHDPAAATRFLASVLTRLTRHDAEVRFFGRELAERYEEITLLYSISEILGSVISLEEAASTILTEVMGTLGASRAALWVYDAESRRLDLVAAVGGEGQEGPIDVDSPTSVTAEVFRERRAMILEPGDEFPRGGGGSPEQGLTTRGSFLSVPMSYTPPRGTTRTIGVINLVGRGADARFSAGDQKLIAAIASQVGAAVENNRLLVASLRQERVDREMELAHDLQLKLLPSVEQFRGYAEVAARCVPAESVGGDFYHLFRLPGGRLGVVIGDVSSHGFGAALIMALTMSAVAIHASEGDPPGEVLRRAHGTLIDELETTEMYLTLFYGVIDPAAGNLTYANAGHSHAFRVAPSGEAHRLSTTNPPFGIVDLDAYGENVEPWEVGDILFLFTDGLCDPFGAGETGGETILLNSLRAHQSLPAEDILASLFELPIGDVEIPSDDRTAVLVRT